MRLQKALERHCWRSIAIADNTRIAIQQDFAADLPAQSPLFQHFPLFHLILERRQSTLPAAVTPTSARKRHGQRQKVRKPSFFPDRQAICLSRQNHSEIALLLDTVWHGNRARSALGRGWGSCIRKLL